MSRAISHFLSGRFDRAALGLMFALSVAIALMLGSGDHTSPLVREFSWQGRVLGSQDIAFVMTFNRPMNQASVENNLRINPPVPGKFSWAGRRMAYTPFEPVPYGQEYQLTLAGARDQASQEEYLAGDKAKGVIRPFTGSFRSRDRLFAYIGVRGEEAGRLILFNLSSGQKTILTPPQLVVADFQAYPNADRILFAATPQTQINQKGINYQLYTVTTGVYFPDSDGSDRPAPAAGKIELILDNQGYSNLKFDLSPDGRKIVIQRMNRAKPSDVALWLINGQGRPERLDKSAVGEFLITPDSTGMAVLQGQGVAIVPLDQKQQQWQFLSDFGRVLDFTPNGSGAAMVQFKTDYTRSLFHVTNQGSQTQLLNTKGSILDCRYQTTGNQLYCLLTELIPGDIYQENPYLALVDLQKKQIRSLLEFPGQRNMKISLAPDGRALLFDILTTTPPREDTTLRTNDGQAIRDGQLWILPLARLDNPQAKPQPEQLPLAGFHPVWLP